MEPRKTTFRIAALPAFLLVAASATAIEPKDVVRHYADIAEANYADSLLTAKALDSAIDAFLAKPSDETLMAAKAAWLTARIPYQQTEVYRFGNVVVDDWEGKVNAWPLDEGLIDYVAGGYGLESDENSLYAANVIANSTIAIEGKSVDMSQLSPTLLAETLHEAGGIEANVATGYHAIEFLLWGQDLNGTGFGAGERPYTDYALDDCTNGSCQRRRAYLKSASELLVSDLEDILASWQAGGEARETLEKADAKIGLAAILTGMGSLSYGELAGERMKLGLLLGDPEEEHDCFSDNTHHSHYFNSVGIQNVYHGSYARIDGTRLSGPSLSELVAATNAQLDRELSGNLAQTVDAMRKMVDRAGRVESYDQMIAENNSEGNKVVQDAIDNLITQTRSIERVIVAFDLDGIELEGSDSLDNPNAVFQ